MISRACLFSIYDKDIANMADVLIRCPPLMSRSDRESTSSGKLFREKYGFCFLTNILDIYIRNIIIWIFFGSCHK